MEENFEEKNEMIENEVVERTATVVDEKGFVVENKPSEYLRKKWLRLHPRIVLR